MVPLSVMETIRCQGIINDINNFSYPVVCRSKFAPQMQFIFYICVFFAVSPSFCVCVSLVSVCHYVRLLILYFVCIYICTNVWTSMFMLCCWYLLLLWLKSHAVYSLHALSVSLALPLSPTLFVSSLLHVCISSRTFRNFLLFG